MIQNMRPQIGIITGFGDKGISDYKIRLEQEFPDYETSVIAGCPIENSGLHPSELARPIRDLILASRQAAAPLILTAHSFGCNPTLIAACEEKLEGVDAAFLIDGPLNPNVDVHPPQNGIFDLFQAQYDFRAETMLACELALIGLDRNKIITFGTEQDLIVPPSAKEFEKSLGIQHVNLSGSGHSLRSQKIDGVIEYIKGFLLSTRSLDATSAAI